MGQLPPLCQNKHELGIVEDIPQGHKSTLTFLYNAVNIVLVHKYDCWPVKHLIFEYYRRIYSSGLHFFLIFYSINIFMKRLEIVSLSSQHKTVYIIFSLDPTLVGLNWVVMVVVLFKNL